MIPVVSVLRSIGIIAISKCSSFLLCSSFEYGLPFFSCQCSLDLGEIARAKFDFDVVGHYSRPEVLSLVVRDRPTRPVTFTSAPEKGESTQR